MNKDQLIALYGIMQIEMKHEGLLTSMGAPAPKKAKDLSEANLDALSLYKYLAEQLRNVPESTINSRKEVFNGIVKSIEQNYLLNMSLFGMFMFEDILERDGTTAQKITLMPKINRLIKWLRAGIIREQAEGLRIAKDSKRGASNVIRIFNGEAELTLEVRNLNAQKWRNIAQNSPKNPV